MFGNTRLLLIGIPIVLVVGLLGYQWLGKPSDEDLSFGRAVLHTISRADFESSITEPGDLESASNIEIRCNVKSRGRAGATILEIVEEGTEVQEGDFLVQFDDSVLKEELIAQRIIVANDRAAEIQAASDLDTAQRTLLEYERGIYEQELSVIEAEVAFAEETLRRAEEYYRHSKRLAVRGYVTDSQLEADQYAVVKAAKELELARQKLGVFEEFTRERMIAELRAEIEKQKANKEAKEFTLQLSKEREQEISEQISKCRVVAPSSGMVVYANDNARGESSIVIEEGVMIRDAQVIIRLPDPDKMQVVTHVNDSKINLVKPGDPVTLWLDTDPENPVRGEVARVAGFPLPRRWYQAPIEYEVFVKVLDRGPTIRPGLRAKCQIYVEKVSQVIQAPVSSLVRESDQYYVLVHDGEGLQPRAVEVGPNNDKFVVIEDGLAEGENVVIDAENFRYDVEFPKS